MAKGTVRFNCGCGFKTDNPIEAMAHADSEHHVMEASGQIRPDRLVKEEE